MDTIDSGGKLIMDLCNYMRVLETISRDLLMMIRFSNSFGFWSQQF